MSNRHERPLRRVNPSRKVRWVARWTDSKGKRQSAGTFPTQKEAQAAIDAAYAQEAEAPRRPDTVGAYAKTWTTRHPRAHRTVKSYDHRVGRVLDVKLEGTKFRDWPMVDIRRRHAVDLVHELLVEQKRSAAGAQGVLRVLSAMWQDAMNDEAVEANPFFGVKVKASDPRVTKQPRRIRVFSWEDMHRFAAAAGALRLGKLEPSALDGWRAVYAEPMIRVLSDCGLRLGELLPLERRDLRTGAQCDVQECRADGPHFHIVRTAHEAVTTAGTKTDHGEVDPGRVVPVPAALEAMLAALPPRIDTRLLFPTTRGRLWRESMFYRDLWWPTQKATGLDVRPHEMRHSFVSFMQAAGVDDADLASITGHTVATMVGRYTHSLGRSFDAVRKAVGE